MSSTQPTPATSQTLAGRAAVITGASRGIGTAIAHSFAQAGADLVLIGRSEVTLQQAAQTVQRPGQNTIAVVGDVSLAAEVERMAGEIEKKVGAVHILVNNAGSSGSHKITNHPDELWNQMIAANLNSTYYMSKAFAPDMMTRRWGRIINIGSVASRLGSAYLSAYTAAKHGVLGLSRALAAELLPFNITVNVVCPGYVDTPMTHANINRLKQRTGREESQLRAVMENASPLHRLMTPEEIAALTLFLAQESSSAITGQALNLDGGMGMFY